MDLELSTAERLGHHTSIIGHRRLPSRDVSRLPPTDDPGPPGAGVDRAERHGRGRRCGGRQDLWVPLT